jgi:quinol---cytochrome c reductase cytochrome c subunit, bacillus type
MSTKYQKEQFKLYKEDTQKRGKAFFPFAMFHDTVMSLVVVSVIVGLACVWYFDSGEEPGDSGVLGPRYATEADPGTTSFVPRPDWYFYFLFYLLRIFKWPNTVVLGTVIIPTIALVLLMLVPFMDRRMERRLSRRPVAVVAAVLVVASMGILTYKGATAKEALASEVVLDVPRWIEDGNLIENSKNIEGIPAEQGPVLVREGANLFAESGCLNCHTYDGSGGQNLGAPDLTDEGAKGRGIQFQIDHLKCPSCVNPGSPMPSFAGLTDAQLKSLAVFLESSKGTG